MVNVKEKDFIEIDYLAKIKDTNELFDATYEEAAKKLNPKVNHAHYGAKIICVGQGHILSYLEKQLIEKEVEKTYIIELTQEQGFGKKDLSLMKIINTTILTKQKITPFPGLQINASGMIGTIRTVNGGRTIVDFNHPLAGRGLVYEIKINRLIINSKEKLGSLIQNVLGIHDHDYEIKIENNTTEIKTNIKINKEHQELLIKKAKELIPELTEIKIN